MSDGKKHALLSPSSCDRWSTCVGSVALTKDIEDVPNEYAEHGTDLHILAAVTLDEAEDVSALDYVGHVLESGAIVTEEDATYVQTYVDAVRAYAAHGTLLVEEELGLTHLTGEPGAIGTSDAIILGTNGELVVIDLKMGQRPVSPVQNKQLLSYASGALHKHEMSADFNTIRLVIVQPRCGGVSEWVCSLLELEAFELDIKRIATQILTTLQLAATTPGGRVDLPLTPSEKACRFCKANPTCPALRDAVETAASVGFDDLESILVEGVPSRAEVIGSAMDKVAMVEAWTRAVRAAAEVELLAGRSVTGYKLVAGRRGARKFSDLEAAEKVLRSTRLKVELLYDMSLISPTVAEKRIAEKFPRIWEKAQALIEQKDGSPSVAPEADKRPAVVVSQPETGFDNLVEADSAADLI